MSDVREKLKNVQHTPSFIIPGPPLQKIFIPSLVKLECLPLNLRLASASYHMVLPLELRALMWLHKVCSGQPSNIRLG